MTRTLKCLCLCLITLPLACARDRKEGKAVFPVEIEGKYGFINEKGKVVIEPRFENAWIPTDGLAAVCVSGKWGYVDCRGSFIVPPQYDMASYFSEGLAGVKKAGFWQYIDRNGKTIVGSIDDNYPSGFTEGVAVAGRSIIDRQGATIRVLRGLYHHVDGAADGLFAVQKPRAGGYVEPLPDGKMRVLFGGGSWGFIDANENVVIEPRFAWAFSFSGGLACVNIGGTPEQFVCKGGKWGYVNAQGKMVVDATFDNAESFSEGLAAVQKDGLYGFIDKAGTLVITNKYLGACRFSEGLASVDVAGKWGFINKEGTLVIQPSFGQPGSFHQGLCSVRLKPELLYGPAAYINREGQIVWQSQP